MSDHENRHMEQINFGAQYPTNDSLTRIAPGADKPEKPNQW